MLCFESWSAANRASSSRMQVSAFAGNDTTSWVRSCRFMSSQWSWGKHIPSKTRSSIWLYFKHLHAFKNPINKSYLNMYRLHHHIVLKWRLFETFIFYFPFYLDKPKETTKMPLEGPHNPFYFMLSITVCTSKGITIENPQGVNHRHPPTV